MLDVNTRFSFFHDRVREAVDTLVTPDAAATLHRTFGRAAFAAIEQSGPTAATDAQVFEVVGHYIEARALVSDPSEIHHVACLLLEAAKRSVASTSYSEAVSYAEAALDFIGGTRGAWGGGSAPACPILLAWLASHCEWRGAFRVLGVGSDARRPV